MQSNKSSFIREQDQWSVFANTLMFAQRCEVQKVRVVKWRNSSGNLARLVLGKGETWQYI